MNKKQVKKKLRALFDKKPHIDQPGRLIAHLQNELHIVGESNRANPLIRESLLELEQEGIIELERSGDVFNAITRTGRKRAKSMKQQQSGQSAPVAVATQAAVPTPATVAATLKAPRPETTLDEDLPLSTDKSIIKQLVERIEEMRGKLEDAKLEAAKVPELERRVAEATRAVAESDRIASERSEQYAAIKAENEALTLRNEQQQRELENENRLAQRVAEALT